MDILPLGSFTNGNHGSFTTSLVQSMVYESFTTSLVQSMVSTPKRNQRAMQVFHPRSVLVQSMLSYAGF